LKTIDTMWEVCTQDFGAREDFGFRDNHDKKYICEGCNSILPTGEELSLPGKIRSEDVYNDMCCMVLSDAGGIMIRKDLLSILGKHIKNVCRSYVQHE